MNTKELDNQYVAHAYGRFDVALTKGQGSTLYDEDGKKYIDFGSGIGVTAFGINDPVWTKAVEEQLHRVQHTSNLYYTAPCAKLAQLLCEKSGMKKVFFGNSGAEALTNTAPGAAPSLPLSTHSTAAPLPPWRPLGKTAFTRCLTPLHPGSNTARPMI